MNTTKHVVLLTSDIFGRGFDSRRLHQPNHRCPKSINSILGSMAHSFAALRKNAQLGKNSLCCKVTKPGKLWRDPML